MKFGQSLGDEGLIRLLQQAMEHGVRTFVTADVYGKGSADRLLAKAIADFPRDEISVVGMIGHDFYDGSRHGMGGYQRFTDPELHDESGYEDYLVSAAERSLERCGISRFDLLLLHNPDSIGYTSPVVWEAMGRLKDGGYTDMLGVAPGPANGFVLDQISCFERFGDLIDWAMIILNPLEPWPGRLVLPAAEKFDVNVMARVVDHSGIFHDDVRPGHWFHTGDHRTHRPSGWVNGGCTKVEAMRPYAERHGLSLLQLAAFWDLAHRPVHAVVPTYIEEWEENDYARSAASKLAEMEVLSGRNPLSQPEVDELATIGDNTGCMPLKGATRKHDCAPLADQWGIDERLAEVAKRWAIDTAW